MTASRWGDQSRGVILCSSPSNQIALPSVGGLSAAAPASEKRPWVQPSRALNSQEEEDDSSLEELGRR